MKKTKRWLIGGIWDILNGLFHLFQAIHEELQGKLKLVIELILRIFYGDTRVIALGTLWKWKV